MIFTLLRSLTLAAVAIATLSGCHSWVLDPTGVTDPTKVYMVGDGLHAGVIMPDGAGQLVEFGYGEWAYYAGGENAWYRMVPVLFWTTQGTLGKRRIPCTTEAELRERFHWMYFRAIPVEHSKMVALRDRLNQRFENANLSRAVRNNGFTFVEDDAGYWMFWNCADEAATWFEELGCDVEWATIRWGLEMPD